MRIPSWPLSRTPARVWRLGAVLALVVGSCSFFTGDPTTTTTTTIATTTTTTTIAFPDRSTTSTTLGEGVDAGIATQLQEQLRELVTVTEAIRGLEFIEEPTITIVTPERLAARVAEDVAEDLDRSELSVDERFFELVGMLDGTVDLHDLLIGLFAEQVVGFYDADTRELVIAGDRAELTPLQRSVLVHELVHALTDQHFAFDLRHQELVDADRGDEAAALEALIEGDATYFQFVYIQDLSPSEQLAIAEEAGSFSTTRLDRSPRWIQEDLAFPYDDGLDFLARLVRGGGIAAVDRAYLDPPLSTEHILHPERYLGGEALRPLPDLDLAIEGYSLHELGSLGEWGLRLLLEQALTPGMVTQTVDGWGADAFGILNTRTDLAFVYTYVADTEEDAIEVAEALVALARTVIGAGDGIDFEGGILFDEGGPWVFIDRIGDGLVFIAATDDDVGRALRPQVRVP